MIQKYNLTDANVRERFADTRDTLCYATNDNQSAVTGMLQATADLAIVVGGYNSSNTSHLVELCEEKLPTYFINNEERLVSKDTIQHYNFHTHQELTTEGYLPAKEPLTVLITSGASCPDALVEGVIKMLNHLNAVFLSFGNLIQLLFDRACKGIIDDPAEMLNQELGDNFARISRDELV